MGKNFLTTFGALPSKPDIRNYRIDMSTDVDLPDTFILPMPPVKNQANVASCVAHALSSLIEYFNGDEMPSMSAGYIYANKTSSGKGMITREAIAQVCREGDVYYYDFPYNEEVPRIYALLDQKKTDLAACARPFSFKTYFALKGEKEIKTAIWNNGPVIIAVDWYKDMRVCNGVVESSFKEKQGGHCMIIYGWNEKGWLIQNSWGTDWGLDGRAVWPYEYKIREAYGVIDYTYEEGIKLKKPFQTHTRIGKVTVRIINFVYATVYGWIYKIKWSK